MAGPRSRFVSSGAAGSKRRLQRGHLTFLPAGTDLTTLSRAPHSGHMSRMFVMTGNDILSPLGLTYLDLRDTQELRPEPFTRPAIFSNFWGMRWLRSCGDAAAFPLAPARTSHRADLAGGAERPDLLGGQGALTDRGLLQPLAEETGRGNPGGPSGNDPGGSTARRDVKLTTAARKTVWR